MKYLFSVLLIVLCFSQIGFVKADNDAAQKMGSSSEIWVDSPLPVISNTLREPSISSQPFMILIVITISLSLFIAIMLFTIFNSDAKKKQSSQNNLNKTEKSNFQILDKCSLDNGQNLYLIQFLNQKFLIASTLTNISLISEINADIPFLERAISNNIISDLDFMTIDSGFTNTNNKSKANGFAALLNAEEDDDELIDELSSIDEKIRQNTQISQDEIQTDRNINTRNNINTERIINSENKFSSFFGKKNNISKAINEIPELIEIAPISSRESNKNTEDKISLKTKLAQTENKITKKPSWLQDKKLGENKFPINLKEKMSANKNTFNKQFPSPEAKTNLENKIKLQNKIEENTEIQSVQNNINKNQNSINEKLNTASQLTSDINFHRTSIDQLLNPPLIQSSQACIQNEIIQEKEIINQNNSNLVASKMAGVSLRRISIVEE